MSNQKTAGYIAIITSLIFAAVLTLVITAVGLVSFVNRVTISSAHFKERSRALAEACVDAALLKLVSSSSYAGNETIVVASDTCNIISVAASSTGKIISAQGVFQHSYTNLQVTVSTGTTVAIVSWQEVPNF